MLNYESLLNTISEQLTATSGELSQQWIKLVWGLSMQDIYGYDRRHAGYDVSTPWCQSNSDSVLSSVCTSVVGQGWKLWSDSCQFFCPTSTHFPATVEHISPGNIESMNLAIAEALGTSPETLALAQMGAVAVAGTAGTVLVLKKLRQYLRSSSESSVAPEAALELITGEPEPKPVVSEGVLVKPEKNASVRDQVEDLAQQMWANRRKAQPKLYVGAPTLLADFCSKEFEGEGTKKPSERIADTSERQASHRAGDAKSHGYT